MTDGSVAPISRVATLVMGQSPAGSNCNRRGKGVPLLNGPTEFGPRHPLPAQWTTEPTRFAQTGDVLFCVRGSTTGRMNRADQSYCVGRGVAAIRGSDPVDTAFLFYTLEARLEDLLSLTAGSVFPNLSRRDIGDLEVWWPSKPVRERIVRQLSLLDDRISSNRAVAGRAETVIDALSEQAAIGLPRIALSSLAVVRRETVDPSAFGGDVVDHLSIPAFDDGRVPEATQALTIKSQKLAVRNTSVLFSRLNPGTPRVWYVRPDPSRPALCSTEFLVLEPKKDSSLAAIWLAVRSRDFVCEAQQRVTGTSGSHQRVRPDDAMAIEVPDYREAGADVAAETLLMLDLAHQVRHETGSAALLLRTILKKELVPRSALALAGAIA